MIVTSQELEALCALVRAITERAKSDPDLHHKAWNTIGCLEAAQYDLHGAFAYTGLAEQGRGNP